MEYGAVIGLIGVILLALAIAMLWRPRSAGRQPVSAAIAARERALATQIEVEEHDIDEMVAARDAIRKRLGRRSIGDELADEALGRRG